MFSLVVVVTEVAENRKFISLKSCLNLYLPYWHNIVRMSLIVSDMIDRQNRKFIRVFSAFFGVIITDWYLLVLLFSFFVAHTVHEGDVWLVSFLTKFFFPAILYVICVVLYRELRVVETMLLFTAISIIVIEYYFVAPIYLNNQ